MSNLREAIDRVDAALTKLIEVVKSAPPGHPFYGNQYSGGGGGGGPRMAPDTGGGTGGGGNSSGGGGGTPEDKPRRIRNDGRDFYIEFMGGGGTPLKAEGIQKELAGTGLEVKKSSDGDAYIEGVSRKRIVDQMKSAGWKHAAYMGYGSGAFSDGFMKNKTRIVIDSDPEVSTAARVWGKIK